LRKIIFVEAKGNKYFEVGFSCSFFCFVCFCVVEETSRSRSVAASVIVTGGGTSVFASLSAACVDAIGLARSAPRGGPGPFVWVSPVVEPSGSPDDASASRVGNIIRDNS